MATGRRRKRKPASPAPEERRRKRPATAACSATAVSARTATQSDRPGRCPERRLAWAIEGTRPGWGRARRGRWPAARYERSLLVVPKLKVMKPSPGGSDASGHAVDRAAAMRHVGPGANCASRTRRNARPGGRRNPSTPDPRGVHAPGPGGRDVRAFGFMLSTPGAMPRVRCLPLGRGRPARRSQAARSALGRPCGASPRPAAVEQRDNRHRMAKRFTSESIDGTPP